VSVAEVESFVERCMRAIGTDPQHCKALSQVLSEADVRGHFTHGLHRLGKTGRTFNAGHKNSVLLKTISASSSVL